LSDQGWQPDKNAPTESRRAAHAGEPGGLAGAERRSRPDRRSGAERRRAFKRPTPAERFAEADRRSEADRRAGADRRAEAERLTRMGRRAAARGSRFGNHRSKWTSRRRLLIAAGALVVVLAVVIPIVVTQTRDEGVRSQGNSADGARSVSSPYDMTEVPATADLKIIKDSKFVSLAIKGASGKLTSYGLDSSLSSVKALETAVMDAKEVDATVAAGGSTITFVYSNRQTVTFNLDVDRGLVSRGGKTWRTQGDLKALVTSATTSST
jgi:hypothetical protein